MLPESQFEPELKILVLALTLLETETIEPFGSTLQPLAKSASPPTAPLRFCRPRSRSLGNRLTELSQALNNSVMLKYFYYYRDILGL